jgi:hypothetical protein
VVTVKPGEETLTHEVGAWERKRNEQGAKVEKSFTAVDAWEKLTRLYSSQP